MISARVKRLSDALISIGEIRQKCMRQWREMTDDSDKADHNFLDLIERMWNEVKRNIHDVKYKSALSRHLSFGMKVDIYDIAINDLWDVEQEILKEISLMSGDEVSISLSRLPSTTTRYTGNTAPGTVKKITVTSPAPDSNSIDGIKFLLHEKLTGRVWDLLKGGHTRLSVTQAYGEITTLLQSKTGLSLDGTDLVGKALQGTPPMIFLSEGESQSAKNIRQGYGDIAKGAYTAVRNIYTHLHDYNPTEKAAARHLILASILLSRISSKPWKEKPLEMQTEYDEAEEGVI